MAILILDDFQKRSVLIFSWVLLSLYSILLVTGIHNTIRYLYKLKVKKTLIISFYLVLIVTATTKAILSVVSIVIPASQFDTEFLVHLTTWQVVNNLTIMLEISNGMIVVLTLQ